jgi:hypothetical protein
MEIWNPADGSVTTIVPGLPQETDQPLNSAGAISVESSRALVVFGGKLGNSYISDIWKYTYSNNFWIKLGNLLSPRCEHVVIIVPGLKCP